MPRRRATTPCPHCDADVPAGALACPACGSDAETGWSDDADSWGGLDDDELDDEAYQEFLRREGLADDDRPSRAQLERNGTILIVALILAALLTWLGLR